MYECFQPDCDTNQGNNSHVRECFLVIYFKRTNFTQSKRPRLLKKCIDYRVRKKKITNPAFAKLEATRD